MTTIDTVKGRYSAYRLLREVGRGGSARVYVAQDVATRTEVAVKQLLGNRPQDRDDWLREVDALTTLNSHHCPHVVEYLDHMQQHDRLFLVEEYAKHGSLRRRLAESDGGRLPETVVCSYVYQVLTALQATTSLGVVHGDLKASNVLLFDSDAVKLTDFALRSRGQDEQGNPGPSIAVVAAGSSSADASAPKRNRGGSGGGREGREEGASGIGVGRLMEFRGSAYWAAPEILAGAAKVTAASDVWSVGCLTVELLTGAPPYFDRAVPNAIHKILHDYYEWMGGEESETTGTDTSASRGSVCPSTGTNGGVGGWEEVQRSSTRRQKSWSMKDSTSRAGSARNSRGAVMGGTTAAVTHAAISGAPRGSSEENGRASSHIRSGSQQDAPYSGSSLLPPLQGDVELTAACMAFLRDCFRPRASDRPSAAALQRHPWFLNCSVPQLLRAAREGRMVGDEGSTGMGGAHRCAVIEQWVCRNLSEEDSRCAAWLKSDAVPLLVPVLTPRVMTPTYIGNVLKLFADFVEARPALAPVFLDRLGTTDLWAVEELTSACDADHLVTLFRRSCELQDTQVAGYTPTDPRALRFVLGLEVEKVQLCVQALQGLMCTHTLKVAASASTQAIEDATVINVDAASDVPPSPPPAVPTEVLPQQRSRARERLLGDGGAAVLCQYVEGQCKTAFISNTATERDWGIIDRLLDVISTVEPLKGGQGFLWGPGPRIAGSRSVTGGAASGLPTKTAGTTVTPRSTLGPLDGSSNTNGGGWDTPPPAGTGPPSVLSSTSCNVRNAAPTAAMGSGRMPSSPGSTVVMGDTGLSVTVPQTSDWVSSVGWLLALQEAARHLCTAAVRLLSLYIPFARETKVEYLEKAGVSLGATLVHVTSNEKADEAVRCTAVRCLPLLQLGSLRAARYLRDPVQCIPLLALTLKRAAGAPALVTCLLAALTTMTLERQMLAACTSCSWMWEALLHLLHHAETSTPAHNDSDPSPIDADRSTGATAATVVNIDIILDTVNLLAQWCAAGSPAVLGNAMSATQLLQRAAPPSLPMILKDLHFQLTRLSQLQSLSRGDLQSSMFKVLRYLNARESSAK